MKLTFLGTGTSFGIPVVGCRCRVCTSSDTRNRRGRHGLLIETTEGRLLVDTPPELRLQLLQAGTERLDAVYVTHPHADHLHGMDDLRIFSLRSRRPLPVYVPAEYATEVRDRFAYIWDAESRDQPGMAVPDLDLRTFEDRTPVAVAGLGLLPIACPHGYYRSYGFRAGDAALVVDAKGIPEDARDRLQGLEVLILGALWRGDPHPAHLNVEEALDLAAQLGAKRTYLTHLTHRLDHADLERELPQGVFPAYDGLVVEC
ncbi:MAG: MBL fold metallo-hydrolase [Gemmatimonadota bacterium]|jgi:phosphoribosyl 1,2-cyclic phosphate phosphodiesterase|nr:MAG: MBL fold metallo-hydrolase [Gemmatimonadota bacterium]